MVDFKIRRGLSSVLFSEPGVVNKNIDIEEGCWYLCTDTAELFIGVNTEDGLTLKRMNDAEDHPVVNEVKTKVEAVILPKVEAVDEVINTVDELKTWVDNKEFLQHIDLDGYATEEFVNTAIEGIKVPETDIYKVDFNAPNFVEAVKAYQAGKLLVLINAAPDTNSYAVMNYVSDKYITFTKFLMSRSETYGAFNTYYLGSDNTWEVAKEAKLNKVEANVEGEVTGELNSIRVGKEIYSLPNTDGLASEEYVEAAIRNIEHPTTDLTGYATEDFVNRAIANIEFPEIPETNLDNYFTKEETISAVSSAIKEKADKILFTTAKFVNNPIGNFAIGDDINGLTIAEIFAKLLGLSDEKPGDTPDTPEVPDEFESLEDLVEYLTSSQANMYSQDANGTLTITPFADTIWTPKEAAAQMDGVSTVYQIKDDSGSIIEAGYQESTDYNEEAWLTIALPDVIKNIEVKMFNPGVSDWEKVNWKVVKAEEQNIEGYTIWTVPEEYEVQSGDTYRFVIIN